MAGLNPGDVIFWVIHTVGLTDFSTLFNWGIIVGALVLGQWLGRREFRLFRDLRRLRDALASVGADPAPLVVERHFAEGPSLLGPFWMDYRTAVRHGEQDHVAPDILRFFSRQEILYTAGVRRSVDAVPALLTMGGILGTFLALVAGLHGLDVGNTHGLSSGITQLIAGLSLKFTASVIGIGLALLWILADKFVWRPRLMKLVSDVERLLTQLFPSPPEELLLQQLHKLQERQAEDLDTLVNDTLLPKLVDGFGQVLDTKLVPHLEALTSHLTEMSGTMKNATEHAADEQREVLSALAGKLVDNLSAQSKEFFRDLTEALGRTIDTQNTMAASLADFTTTVSSSLEGLGRSVEQQTVMLETTQAVVAELQQTAALWDAIPNRLAEHTTVMAQTVADIRAALEDTVRQLAQHQTQAYQHLLTYAEHLDELSQSLRVDLGAASEAMAREQQQAAERLAALLDQAETSNQMALERFNEVQEMSNTLQDSWNDQVQQVTQVRESMGAVVEAVNVIGGDIENSVESLRSEITGTVQALEQNLATGLRRTFEQFDEELSKALRHLSSGVQAMGDLVQEIRVPAERMRQVTASTETLAHTLQRLSTSLPSLVSVPDGDAP